MNKILLIEDSQMISRALSTNISKELDVEVDSAYTLAEAKARLATNHDYFAALVDLTLPDAPDGEALDEVLQWHIPAIVMTASFSEENVKNYWNAAWSITSLKIQRHRLTTLSVCCVVSISISLFLFWWLKIHSRVCSLSPDK